MKPLIASGLIAWVCSACLAGSVGEEVVLPGSPRPAHEPAVAFAPPTGTDKAGKYLVVWQSGTAEQADLYACRLDERGKALDEKPILICQAVECQERVRVAWGKDSWLVVWADLRNDKDYDVYAARVSPEGKLLDAEGLLIAGGEHNQCQPDVAFNGENWLIVWRAFVAGRYVGQGVRMSPAGKALDAAPLKIGEEKSTALSVGELRVAGGPGRWLAVWVSRSSSLTSPAGGGGRVAMYGSAIAGDGTATTAELCRQEDGGKGPKPPVAIASDGKDACLISWFNSCAGGRSGPSSGLPYGALRVGFDAKVLGTTELGGKQVEIRLPAVAWDGTGFLVVFWQGSRAAPGLGRPEHVNRIVAHRVAADGKYEKAVEVSSGEPNPSYAPAVCGDGAGHCLVVYERHGEKAEDKAVIAARLLTR